MSNYDDYLYRLIEKNDAWNNLKFCGALDEKAMRDIMLSANDLYWRQPLKTPPNSMGEAMLLGVSTVASCVGGTGYAAR